MLLKGFASCLTGIRMDAWCMRSFHPHNATNAEPETDWVIWKACQLNTRELCLSLFIRQPKRQRCLMTNWLHCFIFVTYYVNATSHHFLLCLISLWIMLMTNKYYIHLNHLCEPFGSSCEIWTCLDCLLCLFYENNNRWSK